MKADEANKILTEASRKLGEYFDAVQIVASWVEEDDTNYVEAGCGNKFARQRMAEKFLTDSESDEDIEQIIDNEIAEFLEDQDEQ